ncbi:Hypothetical_protein [Hexamita inflata]|uniref:Hypothetical_protein n=1 Tax=Hexamita inflata TaxID=28002 RepID=A0AA86QID6_9EUKA|nr:Hypothetical protein HINF_LOCUS46925 [Hexamita inflata]
MFVLINSFQVCNKNIQIKLVKENFVVYFENECQEYSNKVNVQLDTNIKGSSDKFGKSVNLDSSRKGSIQLNCNDASQIFSSCQDKIRSLTENIYVDVTFRGNSNQEKYYKVEVDVDTKQSDSKLGLTIGLSVGAAVFVVLIIIVIVYFVKRNEKKQLLIPQIM